MDERGHTGLSSALLQKTSRLLLLITAGMILVLSLVAVPVTPFQAHKFFDKLSHMGAYLLLAVFSVFSFLVRTSADASNPVRSKLWGCFLCLLACLGYGALIELLQGFTRRYPELGDLAADLVGSLLGVLIAAGLLLPHWRENPE